MCRIKRPTPLDLGTTQWRSFDLSYSLFSFYSRLISMHLKDF